MNSQEEFKYSTGVVGYPIAFVMLTWVIFWFEVRLNYSFNNYGVYPRRIDSLLGVITSPFIHSDWKHLCNNSNGNFK